MSYSEPPPPPPPNYGGPPPPGYGDQPGGWGGQPPEKTSGMAVASLVLGILGVIPCGWGCFIFSILAIVFGNLGRKEIADPSRGKKGEGLAKWGFYLGIAGLVISALWWVLVATGAIDMNVYTDVS